MEHTALLEKLFRAHLVDLKNIAPEIGDLFVCPICLEKFPIEAIGRNELDEGHVWPDYLREHSDSALAKSQIVLLCKHCNSTAGSRGDKQAQLRAQAIDAEKSGRFYGERHIEVISSGQKPIELNAIIIKTGELTFEVGFEENSKRQWKRNNPEEQARFLSLLEQNEDCTIVIRPPKGIYSGLARVGWLTSAYLLAFYALGYRYILHESLGPVRKLILDSFEKKVANDFTFPELGVVSVEACKTHYYREPLIELVIPVSGNLPVHLEVSFLDCHVKLPFRGIPERLLQVIHSEMPDFEQKAHALAKEMLLAS